MIRHLACIMDGNRRWAKKSARVPWYGHKEGVEAVRKVIEFCLKQKIAYLSLYTFSIENFSRPTQEKMYLFKLLVKEANNGLDEFIEKKIRIRFIGDRSLFPKSVIPVCDKIEQATKEFSTLQVNFLFCYGARQEIIEGIKSIVKQSKEGQLTEHDISTENFKQFLWTGDMPEPDLIIRTGGVKRLSNFLLYQAAYSEFYFLDCLWPEITTNDLNNALQSFSSCKRNFGT